MSSFPSRPSQRALAVLVAPALLLLSALVPACYTTTPRTQVIVRIVADPGVMADMRDVRVVVRAGANREMTSFVERSNRIYDTAPVLPLEIGIIPIDADATRVYEVIATARGAAPERATITEARVVSGFIPGRTLILELRLEDLCRMRTCTGTTCRAGVCVPDLWIDPGTLPALGEDAGPAADAGVDASDAGTRIDGGPPIDGGPDAGPPCGGDARIGTTCVPASGPCEVGVFTCISDSVDCVGGGTAAAAGTECRPVAGLCDVAEACDGVSLACPATDAFASATTVCRADVGECDVAELCNGTSTACGADLTEPVGTLCATGFCNATGACDATCSPGVACSTGNACSLGQVDCTTATPVCVPTGPAPAATECRPAAGLCDRAELCNGTTTVCPADAVAGGAVVCRASVDSCDVAEVCDGVAVLCPTDVLAGGSVQCRVAAAGGCDVAESCTGVSAACPTDVFAVAAVACRVAAAGGCDVAEVCSGTAATCPADVFALATAVCRADAGECDVAETCTGASAACPVDAFEPSGIACMGGGTCNIAGSCVRVLSPCWEPMSAAGAPPAADNSYENPGEWTGSQLITWGGEDIVSGSAPTTGGTYNPDTNIWTSAPTTGAPTQRKRHTAVWTGTEYIVWGGVSGPGVLLGAGGRWNPSTGWRTMSNVGAPTARLFHGAVWTGTQMVVWGGRGIAATPAFDTGASYDPALDLWSPVTSVGAPSARSNHVMVWTGTHVLVWGGYGVADGGLYDPIANRWDPLSSVGAPAARGMSFVGWSGRELLVWGGDSVGGRLASGAIWSADTNTWRSMTSVGAPTARCCGVSGWIGERFVVWGGSGGAAFGGYRGDGAAYNPAIDRWDLLPTLDAPARRAGPSYAVAPDRIAIWSGSSDDVPGGNISTGGVLRAFCPSGPSVSLGNSHSCVLRADGTVACRGANNVGQLGDGTTISRTTLAPVIGIADAVQLSVGSSHACVLRRDATVACWGYNTSGELGLGRVSGVEPAQAVPGLSGVRRVIAGSLFTCAIRNDGTASCWGQDMGGQLGNDAAVTDQNVPRPVAGLTGVTHLSAGYWEGGGGTIYATTCASHNAGQLSCWGNVFGATPALVASVVGAVQVEAGYNTDCARLASGSVACWSVNDLGQLGNGTTVASASPVVVPGVADAVDIHVGAGHVCAVRATGSVSCWGRGEYGQIGDGGFTRRLAPTAVIGIADAVAFAPGAGSTVSTCVVRRTGQVSCWGYNVDGQLGDGTTTNAGTPVTYGL